MLIVYNANMGLVHEERKLTLKKSDTKIVYEGVARSIDTDSINISLPKSVKLFSQQYRYDKLTRSKLLEAHLSKEVSVLGKKVILLSNNGNECVVQTSAKNIITVEAKDIVFATIPKTLLSKPSLVWNINTTKNIKSNMKLDYMIDNISWSSNYILNVKNNWADLSGWININNNSGKSFENTELFVLAGKIHRVREHKSRPQVRYMKAVMADAPSVREQAFEGYHFYSVPFKVNLADKEKTQIIFVDKQDIQVQREYSAMLANPLYLRGDSKSDVLQYISLKGVDIPLPKGVVRTYSKLNKTTILLGESRLQHTPKNTPIKLKLGTNFDLKVIQTVTKREGYKPAEKAIKSIQKIIKKKPFKTIQ